jgi:plastocyanin
MSVRGLRLIAFAYALLCALIAPTALLAADPAPSAPQIKAPTVQSASGANEPAAPAPAGAPSGASSAPNGDARATKDEDAASKDADVLRGKADRPLAAASGSTTVNIKNFSFTPKTVTISVGDSVRWFNRGPSDHTATADDRSFDTGNLKKGESASHTFKKAGTFKYFCQPHPFMKGEVEVVGSDSGGSSGSGDSAGAAGAGGSSSADEAPGGGSGSSSGRLASSGSETWVLALLGAGWLGLGLLLRRRLRNG